MSIFTHRPQLTEMMLSEHSSIKTDCYTCQRLDNINMRLYAKCDQNMQCGARIMIINVVQEL